QPGYVADRLQASGHNLRRPTGQADPHASAAARAGLDGHPAPEALPALNQGIQANAITGPVPADLEPASIVSDRRAAAARSGDNGDLNSRGLAVTNGTRKSLVQDTHDFVLKLASDGRRRALGISYIAAPSEKVGARNDKHQERIRAVDQRRLPGDV